MKRKMRKRIKEFIERLKYAFIAKSFSGKISDEEKINFEKDLLKILDKYNLFKYSDKTALQHIEIIGDTVELPVINLQYLVLKKSKEE